MRGMAWQIWMDYKQTRRNKHMHMPELCSMNRTHLDWAPFFYTSRCRRRFQNLTAQWLVFGDGIYTPHPFPFRAAEFPHEKHIPTALRSSPHSRFARDLRREVSLGWGKDWEGRLSESEQIHSWAPEFIARNRHGVCYFWRPSFLDGKFVKASISPPQGKKSRSEVGKGLRAIFGRTQRRRKSPWRDPNFGKQILVPLVLDLLFSLLVACASSFLGLSRSIYGEGLSCKYPVKYFRNNSSMFGNSSI